MDLFGIRDVLFELGDLLQDLYLAYEYDQRTLKVDLQKKFGEKLETLSNWGCRLGVNVQYSYVADGNRKRTFETHYLKHPAGEEVYCTHITFYLIIDGTKGHVEIQKGDVNTSAHPLSEDGGDSCNLEEMPPFLPEANREPFRDRGSDWLRGIGIEPFQPSN